MLIWERKDEVKVLSLEREVEEKLVFRIIVRFAQRGTW
jgi:hypothetical protein